MILDKRNNPNYMMKNDQYCLSVQIKGGLLYIEVKQQLILSLIISMSNNYNTLLKAKKILSSHNQTLQKNRKYQYSYRPISKQNRKQSLSSSKSVCSLNNKSSFRHKENGSHSYLSLQKKNTQSLVSDKQGEIDKITGLNIKVGLKESNQNVVSNRNLITKISNSYRQEDQSKEDAKKKMSRLDKIMNIKIHKPKVGSTLVNYEPRKQTKIMRTEKRQRGTHLSKSKQKKSREKEQKEERAWRASERERELSYKLQKINQEKEQQERRRREKRFEHLVTKQMVKIEKEREISQRKNDGFSPYIYPFF